MGINKGEHFDQRDIYIDYDYEEVMFRTDHISKKIYRKFYGENEGFEPVESSNSLFNDALLYGNEISKDEYDNGKC